MQHSSVHHCSPLFGRNLISTTHTPACFGQASRVSNPLSLALSKNRSIPSEGRLSDDTMTHVFSPDKRRSTSSRRNESPNKGAKMQSH